MATPATIGVDLADRIMRYRTRYNSDPPHVPITLDELAWLAEAKGNIERMPIEFDGVPLKLVKHVFIEPGGGVVVRP